jgi:hypothetical protein
LVTIVQEALGSIPLFGDEVALQPQLGLCSCRPGASMGYASLIDATNLLGRRSENG